MGINNSKLLKVVAVTFAIAVVGGIALATLAAQQGPLPGGPGRGGFMGRGGPGQGGGFGLGPGGGFRQGRGIGRGGGGPLGPMVMRGLRELDLTEDQRGQLKGVMDSHKAEFKAIGERMMAAREALGDLVTSDAADETAIRAKAAAIAVVEGDAAVLRARVRAEVFALLTPEQQEKAKAMRGQAKGRIKQIVSRVLQNL